MSFVSHDERLDRIGAQAQCHQWVTGVDRKLSDEYKASLLVVKGSECMARAVNEMLEAFQIANTKSS